MRVLDHEEAVYAQLWLSDAAPDEEQLSDDREAIRQQIAALQVRLRPGVGKRPTKRPSPCHSSTPSSKRAQATRTTKTTRRLTAEARLTTPVRGVGRLRARLARL